MRLQCAECACVVERGARVATCPPADAARCCCTHLPVAGGGGA